MDAKFFKPFIDGTRETLKTMCKTELNHGKPFYKGKDDQKIDVSIAAIIALSSSSFSGSISLCFTKNCFLGILSSMLGESYKEITPDTQDGAAELLNIIFGHAKRVLNAQGHDIQKAIPSIIVGDNLRTVHFTNSPILVLPFTTALGEFQIEICSEARSLTGDSTGKKAA